MRLVTFSDDKGTRIGVHDPASGTIVDLSAGTRLPREMTAFIALGKSGLARARRAVRSGEGRIPAGGVKLLAPIPRPAKNVLCVGKNYHDHAKEFQASGVDATGKEVVPEVPIIFTKWPNSVIGPAEPIPSANDYTDSTDYEGELAVVIGEGGRGIARKDAYDHVYGYTIINDVSARDFQFHTTQWSAGKVGDTLAPVGPYIADRAEIPDPHVLDLKAWVNGQLMQDGSTRNFIFDIRYIIEYLTNIMTLSPGDLIATGTPAGVGFSRKPQVTLQPGDTMKLEITGLGSLENSVKDA